eukprot:gene6923-14062_t
MAGRKGDRCEYVITEDRRADHVPSTQAYAVEEVVLDLLHVAACALKIGGSLLYLLPTSYDFTPADLPRHPCLEMEHLCQQPLSIKHCRYLVVMRKTKSYDTMRRGEFDEYKSNVLSGKDLQFGTLLSKLQLALSQEAIANDNVVKQISKSCQKRREGKAKRVCLIQEGKMGEKMRPRLRSLSEDKTLTPMEHDCPDVNLMGGIFLEKSFKELRATL